MNAATTASNGVVSLSRETLLNDTTEQRAIERMVANAVQACSDLAMYGVAREFDLDMHWQEALSEYAGQHQTHCTEFAHQVLERADRQDLRSQSGPAKREFTAYLETGLVERDFRSLF